MVYKLPQITEKEKYIFKRIDTIKAKYDNILTINERRIIGWCSQAHYKKYDEFFIEICNIFLDSLEQRIATETPIDNNLLKILSAFISMDMRHAKNHAIKILSPSLPNPQMMNMIKDMGDLAIKYRILTENYLEIIEDNNIKSEDLNDLKEKNKALEIALRQTFRQMEIFDKWATVPTCRDCVIDMVKCENELRGKKVILIGETLRNAVLGRLKKRNAEVRREANTDFYRIVDIAEITAEYHNQFTAAQYIREFEIISCPGDNLRRFIKVKKK